MVVCLEQGADFHMAPGSPGKETVRWVRVY